MTVLFAAFGSSFLTAAFEVLAGAVFDDVAVVVVLAGAAGFTWALTSGLAGVATAFLVSVLAGSDALTVTWAAVAFLVSFFFVSPTLV